MTISVNHFLSYSGKSIKRSAIREILKLLQKPGMISFAGGLPAPETFPIEDIKKITKEVLQEHGSESLQYGTTEGNMRLRKLLVDRHKKQGLNITIENLAILTGSQQGLDLLGRIFIDRGDYVLCELPSYLGGLNAFAAYGANFKGIKLDENGIDICELESSIIKIIDSGHKIKFIYTIPDFQNPTGITMSESRRNDLFNIAEKYNILIIEDCPYREIRFEGEQQRLIKEFDTSGRVISLFTFSKILAPGFRVGWLVSHPSITDKVVMAKQTADLCTSDFTQEIVVKYLEKGLLDNNILKTIKLYHERRNWMIANLYKYMPDGVTWTEPKGGLFLFVTLPYHLNADLVFTKAVEKNVAFVAGSTFFCNNTGHNTMRINFSYSDKTLIETGVKRLSQVIKDML